MYRTFNSQFVHLFAALACRPFNSPSVHPFGELFCAVHPLSSCQPFNSPLFGELFSCRPFHFISFASCFPADHITLHLSLPLASHFCAVHPLGELFSSRTCNSPSFGKLFSCPAIYLSIRPSLWRVMFAPSIPWASYFSELCSLFSPINWHDK